MGQYFLVCSLDNCSPVNTPMCAKFGECFGALGRSAEVMDALWRPEPGYKRIIAKPYDSLKSETPKPTRYFFNSRYTKPRRYPEQSPANETGKGFSQLSPELVGLIYECLIDVTDVACFAVTCQRCYDIGRRHLEAFVEGTFINSWAGNRLICIGDYASMDDLPPGMLANGEREFVEEIFKDGRHPGIFDKLSKLQAKDPLFYIHRKKRLYQRDVYDLHDFWSKIGGGYSGTENPDMSMEDAETLDQLVQQLPGPPNGDIKKLYGGDYVLRNLTTKEFIRGDAIRDLRGAPEYLHGVSFDHALIIRITWSSDPSLSYGYDGPIQIHRGKWAGHRFDLFKTESVSNEEGAIDGWKDVSREVLDELVEVWGG
ncbi:hypothetical protein D9615_006659 [Tricholomella constricta]|uniref:F-box domain-containing protein n=1 Tax=Tricholomella constricta TaxID=117010 RepID=A0A8H5H9W9_9AGAR|nr:hypothetical protein D9615_006659 [Tricholomella constricta]